MAILFIYVVALGVTLLALFAIGKEIFRLGSGSQTKEEHSFTNEKHVHTHVRKPRKNIKALIFGWEFPPHNSGGLGVACQGLANALQKDTDIVFVLPKELPNGSDSLRFVSAGIPMHAIHSTLFAYPNSKSRVDGGNDEHSYGNDIVNQVREYAKAAGAIAAREPHDVIYAHDWLSFGAGVEAKRISGKPLVAHVHATEHERAGGGHKHQAVYELEREGLHAADSIIAVSSLTKNFIMQEYGIAQEKIHVVWNGIDEHTAPISHAVELSTSRLRALKEYGNKIVLFMGRITVQKGADYLLRAAKIALEKDPAIYFLIAGSGYMRDQIIEEAAALGIAHRVLFAGFLRGAEQAEAYALADLFVMPSVTEPFGITVLEAMRAGTPVLMSKQSGVAEAVTHALRADFWDVEDMARQIDIALNEPAVSISLRHNGMQEVASLTWDLAASKVRDVMDSLVIPPLAIQAIPIS